MSSSTDAYSSFYDAGFKAHHVKVPPPPHDPDLDLTIHALVYEPQSAAAAQHTLLLLHGHPQSCLVWHKVAPRLVKELNGSARVIVPDLRGHGKSTAPKIERNDDGSYANDAARAKYTKREMARDMVEVVKALGGHDQFYILSHDRGSRVAHRLALDYPTLPRSIIILDIAPTVDMYESTDVKFAIAYWHWFFLVQPHPVPEKMLLGAPRAYLEKMTTRSPQSERAAADDPIFPHAILDAYEAQLSSFAHVEATCEDYRQASPLGLDWVHDKQSRAKGEKIKAPVRVLWGAKGIVEMMYGREKQLSFWKACCEVLDDKGSKAVPSGHYIPEELPDVVVESTLDFFKLKV